MICPFMSEIMGEPIQVDCLEKKCALWVDKDNYQRCGLINK